MSDEVRVTVIATGFGDENQKMITDQISKLKLMAQANLLNSMPDAQGPTAETLTPSAMSPMSVPSLSTAESISPQQPVAETPVAPQPVAAAEPVFTQPLSTPVNTGAEALPRDILMAKVKAFKDSQQAATNAGTEMQPEQLTMNVDENYQEGLASDCLLYTSPSPRDQRGSRMPSSA